MSACKPWIWWIFGLFFGLMCSVLSSMAWAQSARWMGVASCANSLCHGATKPQNVTRVQQNEYLIYQREDRHTQIFKVLANPQSQRISRNLGLGNAQNAQECLVCHSPNVPRAQQGEKFELSDGLGCEGCHGASEHWLSSHTNPQQSHAENVRLGLIPLDDPKVRAKLCLGCHQGDDDHPMTHRIMGAGHPPISGFELDTFTAIQPAHYTMDSDYRQRKSAPSSVQTWALGQFTMAALMIENMASNRFHTGLFPELVFFDCEACHHAMSPLRWDADTVNSGLPPGQIRLNVANLRMAQHLLNVNSPQLAARWRAGVADLNQSLLKGEKKFKAELADMRSLILQATRNLESNPLTIDETRAVLRSLANAKIFDYVEAEQAVMAMSTLLSHLERNRGISTNKARELNQVLNGCYDSLKRRESYSPDRLRAAQQRFAAGL